MATEQVHLTTSEVASLVRVDSSTVRRWVERGVLRPSMVLPGGQYRFNEADVTALLTPAIPQSTPSPALPSRSPHPGEGVSASEAA